jgi:hypothetical protein
VNADNQPSASRQPSCRHGEAEIQMQVDDAFPSTPEISTEYEESSKYRKPSMPQGALSTLVQGDLNPR